MTEVSNSEPKYEPTGADRVARLRYRRFDRPVSKVQNSEPKHEPTYSLKKQTQLQEEQPVAPPFNETGPGDADRATAEGSNSKPEYEPTDAERAQLEKQAQRRKEQPVAPRLKVVADYRGTRVEVDHPEPIVIGRALLKEALATVDDDFYDGLISKLCELVDIDGPNAETELNMVLSTIINGKPIDQCHTVLLFQFGACFLESMRYTNKSSRIDAEFSAIREDLKDKKFSHMINEKNYSLIENLSQLMETTQRNSTRSTRTGCLLLEASDRHRRAGERSIAVQQLTLARQAFVANISHAAPQTSPNNQANGPLALTDQQHSAMPIIDEPDRVPVPARRRKMQ